MESNAALSQELIELLHLEQPPIAISFSDVPPEGVATYHGQAPAGCRFWQDAATSTFTTSARDHELCAIGVHTHNLQSSPAQQKDLMDALKMYRKFPYSRISRSMSLTLASPKRRCLQTWSSSSFGPTRRSFSLKQRSNSRTRTLPRWVGLPAPLLPK
jgi:hypothetical protein